MMTYRRGDIVLVRWPDSDLAASKSRPARFVQADGLATGLSQVTAAGITSNLARGGPPFRVLIPRSSPAGRGAGLRPDSVVTADNPITFHLREIDRRIGVQADMSVVDAALRIALAL